MRAAAAAHRVPLAAENALPRFDEGAHAQIVSLASPSGPLPGLASFTYLRLSAALFEAPNWRSFARFVGAWCSRAAQPHPQPAGGGGIGGGSGGGGLRSSAVTAAVKER